MVGVCSSLAPEGKLMGTSELIALLESYNVPVVIVGGAERAGLADLYR